MKAFISKTVLALSLALSGTAFANTSILNVSYDVMRDFYKDLNPAFQKSYKAQTGQDIAVQQSHGGSSKQAMSVVSGLEADVITMNQAPDIDLLAERGALVPKNWQQRLPDNAAPFTSTMIFLVRKGNPKAIKDWSDLVKPGVTITLPHPKNTGNGRNTYLSAWGWAQRQPGGNDKTAAAFVGAFLKNVPAFAPGGRDATTNFIQRGQGDVLGQLVQNQTL